MIGIRRLTVGRSFEPIGVVSNTEETQRRCRVAPKIFGAIYPAFIRHSFGPCLATGQPLQDKKRIHRRRSC